MKTRYRQCKLVRRTSESEIHTVSYIPEKFAVVGKVLKLRQDKDDDWVDGWVVEFAGHIVNNPPDFNKMARGHKRATGDSLPKMRR